MLLALLIACFAIALTPAASSAQDSPKTLLDTGQYVPDIGTFLSIGASTLAGYDWDGEYVYFNSRASGVTQVYRLGDDGWPHQLTFFEHGIDFFSLSWGGDKAIVGASVGGNERSQLFLLATQTGKIVQLTDAPDVRFGSVRWAKDDLSIYYYSNEENGRDFNVHQMSIVTGESKKVFGGDGNVAGWNIPGSLSQDGTKMIVMHLFSNVETQLFLLDLTTGAYQSLTDTVNPALYDSPHLMPDNETIYLLSNNNDDGMTRLAKMKIGSTDVEFIDDGWLDPKWEADVMGISRDYKYMGILINEEGYHRIKMREIESKQELPSPPLDGYISDMASDKDGRVVLSFDAPTYAPDVWRWDPATEELEQLTFTTYAGIDRELFSDPTLVKFKSFDGLEIPAFLYLPPDYKEGEPVPFIINAHGGPESQFEPQFLRNFQYLILNGYGVLAVNPRGSSGYGREYEQLDNYKNRQNSLKDYKAAADWLVAEGYSTSDMMAIRGGSYGGYVVLGMITEYPELFAAGIESVGIANFVTFLEQTADYRRYLREAEYGPLSDREFLKSISPIHKANLIQTPLMVIHGVNDPRVPVGEARQIIEAIEANGGTVEAMIMEEAGHGAVKRSDTIEEYRRQVEFLNKYLKPQDEPAGI